MSEVALFSRKRKRARVEGEEGGRREEAAAAAARNDATDLEEGDVATGASSKEEVSFASLGLASWVAKACQSMGFRRPTPVQELCIPAVLAGRDVMGCAETGSGKTAAFALPMLHRLSEDPYGIFGLVLTPTRELAIQIAEQFEAFGAPMGLRLAVVIGGQSMVSVCCSVAPHMPPLK
jgi:ATP-dependent RNA helicase DDX49/DBP8